MSPATEPFTHSFNQIYKTHGRLDGVIHGAGVVEDKLIRDKKSDSFARVFSTKVESAMTSYDLVPIRSNFWFFSLPYQHTWSSGQVDYSAANEVLNKFAAISERRGRVASWLSIGDPGTAGWSRTIAATICGSQYSFDLLAGARQIVDELRSSGKVGDPKW